ncbi:uncharacterized protein Z520_04691 [Fonsecaea multimorphosa CBS 102226]|uniref:Carboxymuconolactone decarboxylase-like domain-containing protein n=1 Tax=Fonsecaea multimorphosa CBS 102226 TaxID=1442371 RepID=A0A0D2HB38_9EURO|nr:uncharacterized protein Z520_04691 [Fonsecaea multimorphosa CBS 102226]KIX99115.1 hypothetical protein Z520_04691 [Fonsecaea multimorphosa CBS 102226]OAL26026.1 hypothetical protein AYO22_04440 [Fonsecaea multimorphosa]
MRLDYVPNPPAGLDPEDEGIVERIKARRGARGLITLDLTLLHAPKIAGGWNALMGAIRTQTSIPDDIREIIICRVALINRAWVEWNVHTGILLASSGFTEEKLAVVQELSPLSQGTLDDRQWVVLRFTDAMTREVVVPQDLFDEVKAAGFGNREIVELTAAVASYNMVSRFIVALDIAESNDKAPG